MSITAELLVAGEEVLKCQIASSFYFANFLLTLLVNSVCHKVLFPKQWFQINELYGKYNESLCMQGSNSTGPITCWFLAKLKIETMSAGTMFLFGCGYDIISKY
jgi:hypothetical protein